MHGALYLDRMCSVPTILQSASVSFSSLCMKSVLEKVGFTLETKPSFFEASITPPSVIPAATNLANYKRGSCLTEWVEVQDPGLVSTRSLRRNTSDCIRVASSIAVELQLRIARLIASTDSSQKLSLPSINPQTMIWRSPLAVGSERRFLCEPCISGMRQRRGPVCVKVLRNQGF